MKKLTTVILIFLIVCITHNAYSQDDLKIANSLAEQGIVNYKKGNITGAIDYFSRALLLDPHNYTAQQNLIKISNNKNLTTKQKINLLLFEDILENILELKKKITYYEKKRNSMGQDLVRIGYDRSLLDTEMMTIQNYIINAKESSGNKEKAQYSDQDDPLQIVNVWLGFEKDQLFSKMLYLQRQNARLRELSKEYAQSKLNESKAKSGHYSKSFIEMPPIEVTSDLSDMESGGSKTPPLDYVTNAKSFIDDQQNEIKSFQTELSSVNTHVEKLENDLGEKDVKVDNLSDQIVNYALKLTEKENILTDKVKDLVALNQELADLQARLELGQKMIADKDEKIALLKYRLGKTSAGESIDVEKEAIPLDFASQNNEKIIELNNILDIYRQKLSDSEKEVANKSASLYDLTNNLVKLQEQVESGRRTIMIGERTLEARDKHIRALKRTIDTMRAKKDENHEILQRVVSKKDAELNDLNQVLSMYRSKLSKANEANKSKDASISTLEEQLMLVQTKLFHKDRNLQEANDKLSSLEEQLLSMQNKLQMLTDTKNIDEMSKPWVDQEIKDLKKKLQEIHVFLQKDIQNSTMPVAIHGAENTSIPKEIRN